MANLINLSLGLDRTRGLAVVDNRDLYNVENRVIEDQGIEHDSEPETDHEDQESSISDCESMVVGDNKSEFQSSGEKLVRLNEEDKLYKIIAGRLVLGLGNLGLDAQVEGVCRNFFAGFTYQARFHSFRVFQKALERRSGAPNVKYAWYGATKDEIKKILAHGFGHCSQGDGAQYGTGVYLSPFYAPLESVQSAVEDDDGLRYLLLCRVLLGRAELVRPGSQQYHPSSSEFDSGVDNLECPKKHIVWGTQMNTHILPEFLVTFTAQPCSKGYQRTQIPLRKPTSPWMPFPSLISTLAKVLPPDATNLIMKYHRDNRDNKISRQELIQRVREIAGDNLLATVIRSFRNKNLEAPTVGTPSKFQQRKARLSACKIKN